MVNNFQQIKGLMDFPNNGDFYFVQLLMRRKDNNEDKLDRNVRLIKSYYISTIEQLDDLTDEIIGLCNYFNARAYINLNRRNYEKCSLQTARLILDQIANKDYKSSKKAFNTVCGRYSSETDKKWLLDYDNGMLNPNELRTIAIDLANVMPLGDKVIDVIPTKNGCHIITSPFNLKDAESTLGFYDLFVHKNNPTLIYIP